MNMSLYSAAGHQDAACGMPGMLQTTRGTGGGLGGGGGGVATVTLWGEGGVGGWRGQAGLQQTHPGEDLVSSFLMYISFSTSATASSLRTFTSTKASLASGTKAYTSSPILMPHGSLLMHACTRTNADSHTRTHTCTHKQRFAPVLVQYSQLCRGQEGRPIFPAPPIATLGSAWSCSSAAEYMIALQRIQSCIEAHTQLIATDCP